MHHVPHLKTEVNLRRNGKYSKGHVFSPGQLRKLKRYTNKVQSLQKRLMQNYRDFNWWAQNSKYGSNTYQSARTRFFNRHLNLVRQLKRLGVSLAKDPYDWVLAERSRQEDRKTMQAMLQWARWEEEEEVRTAVERVGPEEGITLSADHPRWTEDWDSPTTMLLE